MSDSRKRRGSAALPSYMRYARPRHNLADQGSLVKDISAAGVLAATIVVMLVVRTGHGGESFVRMMHLQRYVYIQQWWYNSRVYARIAALLAVRTGHTAVI